MNHATTSAESASETRESGTPPQQYPKYCDLVLKGGITSGVVYPGAIAAFAKHYQFRQIGGTSAGAIAAAAAAAAQLGCVSNRNKNAFDQLAELPTFLGQKGSAAQSNLFKMFRPTAAAEKLFSTFTAAAGGGKTALLRVIRKALRNYAGWAALGAAPAAIGAFVTPAAASVLGCIIQILLVCIILAVGVAFALVWALLREASRVLPRQGWGLSAGVWRDGSGESYVRSRADGDSADAAGGADDKIGQEQHSQPDTIEELNGHEGRGKEDPAVLSSWLHGYLNTLAGLGDDKVLTFGHLWLGTGEAATQTLAECDRKIDFKAMTTALNLHRPVILPFDGDDAQELYFRENDLLCVLPRIVVGHMAEKARALPPPDGERERAEVADLERRGYLRVPRAHDLPVILAVRMSLSFPLLLSAVRFYKPDHARSKALQMQPLWFSDGGICSNLPVHLFDSPLPTHPTFTINLVESRPADSPKRDDVFVPMNAQGGGEGQRNYFHEEHGLAGVAAFLLTIVDSARNWVDNGQLRLPGYRERVGSVVVHPNEGGLNLDMPEKAITALSKRGAAVADELHKAFSEKLWLNEKNPANSNGWERHQWIRLRNQLGALSPYFVGIRSALKTLDADLVSLQEMVDRHPGTDTDEDRDDEQRAALKELLAALSPVLEASAIDRVVDKSHGQLRIRPR